MTHTVKTLIVFSAGLAFALLAAWRHPYEPTTLISIAAAKPKMEPYAFTLKNVTLPEPVFDKTPTVESRVTASPHSSTPVSSQPAKVAPRTTSKPTHATSTKANAKTHTPTPKKRVVLLDHQRERLAEVISKEYPAISEQESRRLIDKILAYSAMYKVDPMLVVGIIAAESGFNKNARSPTGAIGYMQVHPRWHKEKYRGRDLKSPDTNVEVGVMILKDCYERTNARHSDTALACYNGATTPTQARTYAQAVNRHVARIASKLN
jgi:hypothetical protein